MAGNIKGITIEIGGDTTKLEKALKGVNSSARDLGKQLKNIGTSMKFNPGNAELATQKQRVLAESIENTKKKLETLKTAQEQASAALARGDISQAQYDALTREIMKTENQLKSLEAQANKTNQTLLGIRDASMKIGETTGKIGSTMTKTITAPLVAGAGVVTKFAADFDTAMVGVAKTVDMTDQEFEAMSNSIRGMAKEMPASAVEIAGVAEAAGQLGIEKENILGFTKTMIDLGETTNLTADEASTSFAKFANITQMPQTEFDKLGSVVVDLGNNMATTEKDIVSMGTRLAGTGNQVGLTEAEIMGLAAAMSSVGIEAEAGGSAMSTTLKKINTEVLSGGDKLKGYAQVAGMSANQFAEAWKSRPTEALTSFISGLKDIQASGGDVNSVLKELGITGLRETDTLTRLAGAGDLLGSAFDIANGAFRDNTALSAEAEKRYESFGAKMDMFKNKLTDAGITIGTVLMPHIEKLVDGIGNLADKIAAADPVLVKVGVAVAAFAAAIGPVLIIISKVATVIGTVSGALAAMGGATAGATPAMLGLAKVFGVIKTAFLGLLGLIQAHPLVAIITAVATILIPLIIQNWSTIKEFLINTWNSIKESASIIWQGITQFLSNLWISVSESWSTTWMTITTTLSELWQSFIAGVQPIWEGLVTVFQFIWEAIKEIFNVAWIAISTPIILAWQVFIATAKTIFDGLVTFFKGIWEGIKSNAVATWNAIKGVILPIWEALKSKATEVFNAIKAKITEVWNGIKSKTTEVWNGIKSALLPIWESLKTKATEIFNAVKTKITEVWNDAKSKTTEIWNGIKSSLPEVWNGIKSTATETFNAIKTKITEVWNGIKSATTSTWNAVKQAIEKPINTARDLVSKAIEKMKSLLSITLPFPKIKLPHFNVSGKFSLNPPSVPHFNVQWYDKGGIFKSPSVIGVGEKRPEFVGALDDLKKIVADVINENSVEGSGRQIIIKEMNVRNDNDIKRIAEELYRLEKRNNRGRGLAI
jgi:TP901 family phage tail tape measure protein|nr:MAG TPA: tail tape measure [Caudoviricetes sp.]